ncbi:winged helix-turn-helix DNA-binding protein [Natranaerovirga hydrolytica]|uniref:Winged helix-turn-helix DNA-binding protein n=1 Tax=Natranaerovirga hydrolytica TaxID=680378 RepID=A0A4R1N6F9_9FIRM|nr:winged helix-turn-helix transcriptional regulator [Natranaerovirga hydrolytica]TCK98213.1 winged helix-turn-helix DNA-binding protein [Natranaerovirga hydrolytica]
MKRDFFILDLIDTHNFISQRLISKETGYSLGTVNNVLQSFIHAGYLDIVQDNSKTVDYLITTKGKLYKAKCYYAIVENSYDVITSFKKRIKETVNAFIANDIKVFLLYGEKNNIYRLLKMNLIEASRKHSIEYYDISEIPQKVQKNAIVMLWDTEQVDSLAYKKENTYNLFL